MDICIIITTWQSYNYHHYVQTLLQDGLQALLHLTDLKSVIVWVLDNC